MPFTDSVKLINVIRDDADALTATPDRVLEGEVFVGKAKKFETGLIPILPIRSTITLSAGQSINIDYGHNPSPYQVKVVGLNDQTQATAVVSDIKTGKTAWVNGVLITGTMPLIAAKAVVLDCGESHTIPLGYHDGNAVITAASLASQTQATSTTADILEGKTAWVNGVLLAGIMPNNGTVSVILDPGQEYTVPLGYHSGLGKVSVTSLSGNTSGTAIAGDIRTGKTAWVNGVLITGTVPEITGEKIILDVNGTYTIPLGMHGGLGTVTQEIETVQGLTITPTFEDQTVSVAGKYMENDIIVTGLDAWNYQNFNSNQGQLFSGTFRVTDGSVTLTLPVDNWHDQATNNLYHINILYKGGGSTDYLPGGGYGVVFLNNLNSSARKSHIVSIDDCEIEVKRNTGTNAHTFKITLKNTPADIDVAAIEYTISEIMSLRRYGDEHDTKTQ